MNAVIVRTSDMMENPKKGDKRDATRSPACGACAVRQDQQVSFAIYVLVTSVVIAMMGVLLFLFGNGPDYLTPEQIRTYVRTQPVECQPIARARLKRRLVQENIPLRANDMVSVLRELDAKDCVIASRQLETLEEPTESSAR